MLSQFILLKKHGDLVDKPVRLLFFISFAQTALFKFCHSKLQSTLLWVDSGQFGLPYTLQDGHPSN